MSDQENNAAEMPFDIVEAAETVVDSSWDGDQFCFLNVHIERALLKERRRCAEVAKAYLEDLAGCDLSDEEPSRIAQMVISGRSAESIRENGIGGE